MDSQKQADVKKPTSLDSIPDDLALAMAEQVKSWGEIEGSLEKKEKASR